MQEHGASTAGASVSTEGLLNRVEMLTSSGETRRSNPLLDPPAFRELAARLADTVEQSYDLIVVRDLFGDRVLGYQLALITGKPTAVSYDREGMIVLEDVGSIPQGSRVLIAADTHFTTHSIHAVASGAEQAGMQTVGLAVLLQQNGERFPFPVWALQRRDA